MVFDPNFGTGLTEQNARNLKVHFFPKFKNASLGLITKQIVGVVRSLPSLVWVVYRHPQPN